MANKIYYKDKKNLYNIQTIKTFLFKQYYYKFTTNRFLGVARPLVRKSSAFAVASQIAVIGVGFPITAAHGQQDGWADEALIVGRFRFGTFATADDCQALSCKLHHALTGVGSTVAGAYRAVEIRAYERSLARRDGYVRHNRQKNS